MSCSVPFLCSFCGKFEEEEDLWEIDTRGLFKKRKKCLEKREIAMEVNGKAKVSVVIQDKSLIFSFRYDAVVNF